MTSPDLALRDPGAESFRAAGTGRSGLDTAIGTQALIDAGHRVNEQSATNGHSNGYAESTQVSSPETAFRGVQIPDRPRHPSGFPNYQEPLPTR